MSDNELATGRWPYVLAALGIPAKVISGKHQPCPFCGGKDRFRFTDHGCRGSWICNSCCPPGSRDSDGFGLLMRHHGWSFHEAIKQVESVVGSAQVSSPKQTDEARILARLKAVWNEGEPLEDSVAGLYLMKRVGFIPQTHAIRSHPALAYHNDDGTTDYYAGMIAAVTIAGKPVSIHRTYLTDKGEKAQVPAVKKLMTGLGINGASIAIGRPVNILGVAEGIETALACSKKTGYPVWPAISANGMSEFVVPDGVKKLVIFGDNDASFTGQAAAYALAKKAKAKGLDVEVHVPKNVNCDWLDVLMGVG